MVRTFEGTQFKAPSRLKIIIFYAQVVLLMGPNYTPVFLIEPVVPPLLEAEFENSQLHGFYHKFATG